MSEYVNFCVNCLKHDEVANRVHIRSIKTVTNYVTSLHLVALQLAKSFVRLKLKHNSNSEK